MRYLNYIARFKNDNVGLSADGSRAAVAECGLEWLWLNAAKAADP